MTEVLIEIVTGALCICSFYLGLTCARDEEVKGIEFPKTINPMQKFKEQREKKAAKKQQEIDDIIMQNIDNYDGTANGQKDIPG